MFKHSRHANHFIDATDLSNAVTFLRTATSVTVTDTNPPPGGVFYRFEAVLEP